MSVENRKDMAGESNSRRPHPKKDDPLEIRIRDLIREQAYRTPQGKQMWEKSKDAQLRYFREALGRIDDVTYVHERTQQLLSELAKITNAHIVLGEENLRDLRLPALVVLNHYSGYKNTTLQREELGIDLGEMDELYPFPVFYSSVVPAARKLGEEVSLYDAHLEYSPDETPLRKLQEEAGLLVIPENGASFQAVLELTRDTIKRDPNSLVVVFPEGETSGKRNSGGPYDMVSFHTGPFAIASILGIPVLPVAQYFNPESGFEIGIGKSIQPDTNRPREEYSRLAESTRQEMRGLLSQMHASLTI